ncbi:hypothetical protein QTP88_020494 [Uroleucon formosanum]
MHKLCNPVLKQFLEKYTKQNIPNESTLRKNYIPDIYKNVIEKIINDIGDNYVYLIVDETNDSRGLSIANLLIGKLDGNTGKSYLISCKELVSTNYETICQFANFSLKIFLGIEQRALFFISDAGTYMVKAAKTLKIFSKINSYYMCQTCS